MIDPPEYDLRDDVMRRDKCCIAYRMVQMHLLESHQCRDKWDRPHLAHDISKLTMDHVWPEFVGGVRGKKPPTDKYHLVAACSYTNVPTGGGSGPNRTIRDFERSYLRGHYPDAYGPPVA